MHKKPNIFLEIKRPVLGVSFLSFNSVLWFNGKYVFDDAQSVEAVKVQLQLANSFVPCHEPVGFTSLSL